MRFVKFLLPFRHLFAITKIDGIRWLDRLRRMHLNGILADDMGLGKTLQAITTLTQYIIEHPEQTFHCRLSHFLSL